MAKLMSNIDLGSVGTPLHHGPAERALPFAKDAPIVVNVHQDAFCAQPPYHLFGTISREGLRGLVPIGDSALWIGKVHTVEKVVQNHLENAV
jgi:hypothetical protein